MEDWKKKISHTNWLNYTEKALLSAEQQEDTTPADIITLCRLRSLAAKKQGSTIKQKTIKDFSQNF